MANEVTKVILDLDNADFVKKLQDSLGWMGKLTDATGFAGLKEALVLTGELVGVLGVAVLALKTSIDFVEEGEKIRQVNAAFEAMAESAGLAADVIKEKLVHAADGLVSETELLKSANKAIAAMGENAEKIPQIMEISRKATALFGGDLITNFEHINGALAAGNVRMLRHYGIIVDVDKATKEYAKSLGTGTDFLNQAGHRQAVFNAALEQATEKFKDVNVDITATSNAFTKMGVSLTEIKEAIILVFDKVLGPLVRRVVGGLASDFHVLAQSVKDYFGETEKKGELQAKAFQKTREQLEQEIALNKALGKETKELEIQLKKLDEAKKDPKTGKTNTDKELEEKRKFEKDLLGLHQARIAAEEKMETTALGLAKLHDEEKVNLEKQTNLKLITLRQQYYDGDKLRGTASANQYAEAKKQIEKKLVADLKQIDQKRYDDELNAAKNMAAQNQTGMKGFVAGWKSGGAEAGKAVKSFAKLGEVSLNSVSSHAKTAFQQMGDGSKTGAEAMKGFILGSLGDIAMEWGTFHLINGLATYNAVEVAEGGALIALGAALSSMSGSGASSSSSADTGGGGGSGPGFSPGGTSTTPAPVAAPQKKSVTVQIMGHYFETDQTRTRMMDMIRQAGDFTDFNLKQIGQP